ncbi:Sodium/hydrogen exchanger family-domain-containing protein [Gaertneriomyces semiglobifer]|nr:Sodium/hydrogen exchanger family-domain-containing protein [Gaertneriomyces semiglobifer]
MVMGVVKELSRFTIALQLWSCGITLPPLYVQHRWRSLFVLLVPNAFYAFFITSAFAFALFPFRFLESLLLGASLTATDPVLASSIVRGTLAEKYLPTRVRNILTAESGANDGIAYAVFMMPLLLMRESPGHAIGKWIYEIILFEIMLAVLVGAAIGYVAGRIERIGLKDEITGKDSMVVITVALTLVTVGVIRMWGGNEFFACFTGASVYARSLAASVRHDQQRVQSAFDYTLTAVYCVLLGLVLPWHRFYEIGYGLLISFSILSVLFRRVPIFVANARLMPVFEGNVYHAIFTGFFGPMGSAAVYYAVEAHEHLESANSLMIYDVVLWTVFSTGILFGVLSFPGMRLLHLLDAKHQKEWKPPGYLGSSTRSKLHRADGGIRGRVGRRQENCGSRYRTVRVYSASEVRFYICKLRSLVIPKNRMVEASGPSSSVLGTRACIF